MTDPRRKTYSEWPLYREDDISEWAEEYEHVFLQFSELMNMHAGVRCDGTKPIGSKEPLVCDICRKITGNPYKIFELLLFINSNEAPQDR